VGAQAWGSCLGAPLSVGPVAPQGAEVKMIAAGLTEKGGHRTAPPVQGGPGQIRHLTRCE